MSGTAGLSRTASMEETPAQVRETTLGVRRLLRQLGWGPDLPAPAGPLVAVDQTELEVAEGVAEGLRANADVQKATGVDPDAHEGGVRQVDALVGALRKLKKIRTGLGDRQKVLVAVRRVYQNRVDLYVQPLIDRGDSVLDEDFGAVAAAKDAGAHGKLLHQQQTRQQDQAAAEKLAPVLAEEHFLRTLLAMQAGQPVPTEDKLKAAETLQKLKNETGQPEQPAPDRRTKKR